jgi:hypothetical protein
MSSSLLPPCFIEQLFPQVQPLAGTVSPQPRTQEQATHLVLDTTALRPSTSDNLISKNDSADSNSHHTHAQSQSPSTKMDECSPGAVAGIKHED